MDAASTGTGPVRVQKVSVRVPVPVPVQVWVWVRVQLRVRTFLPGFDDPVTTGTVSKAAGSSAGTEAEDAGGASGLLDGCAAFAAAVSALDMGREGTWDIVKRESTAFLKSILKSVGCVKFRKLRLES